MKKEFQEKLTKALGDRLEGGYRLTALFRLKAIGGRLKGVGGLRL
jgi:hypothetical protein